MSVTILSMGHKHPVYDTDKHFIIDPITKQISTDSPKLVLAQKSHNSERITFEIPKEIEGHDMSVCNLVEIHYQNIDAKNATNKNIDIYKVTDLQHGTGENKDVVFCSWLVGGSATAYAGGLIFAIHFACIAEDGTIDYSFPTLSYSGITVGETTWNSGTIAKDHPDILAQFEARIQALEQGVGVEVKSAYEYAVEAGYKGTEEEFAEQMADPLATTITDDNNGNVVISALGAVSASDDGNGNVELNATSVLPDTDVSEEWVFTLEDGSTVTRRVVVK